MKTADGSGGAAPETRHGARLPYDAWWLDAKLGIRMLVKYPGLALAGGAGIALAVAIAAGGFSFIYANFRASSLPLEESGRLVSIELWDAAAAKPEGRIRYDYQLWREAEWKSLEEISAFRTARVNLIAPESEPEAVEVAMMSASGFRVARVLPLIGRRLEEADERRGAPAVVVIAEDVWRNRFASDPAILGRTIQLGAAPYSIVGVMPKGFAFPVNHHFWIALRTDPTPSEPLTGPELRVFARLAPGATTVTAQAELSAIRQRTAPERSKAYAQFRPQVMPYPNPFLGMNGPEDWTGLMAMQGLFIGLLVLVCLNVAILVYTRTAMRQAEIGLRTALGASRGRIVSQLFVEALVLSVAAATAGVGIAAFALRQVAAAATHIAVELPFWISFRLMPEAVLYATGLAVVAAAIVGILPALEATRRVSQTSLRVVGAGGMRFGKTWTVLIVAQVAFAVAILPVASSSVWKDARDGMAGLGFPAQEFLSGELSMDRDSVMSGAEARDLTGRFAARQAELARRLEADPHVAAVTFAMANPGQEPTARIEARRLDAVASQTGRVESGDIHEVRFNRVDPNFFRTFEVPLLGGRRLRPEDSSAVVVNQSLANRVFGGNALGARIRYVNENAGAGVWHEIVGIVKDFPTGVNPGMRGSPLSVYHAAVPGQAQPAAVAIRIRGAAPSAFSHPLTRMVAAIDPDLHVRAVRPLDEVMRSEQWISRLQAAVAAAVTLSVLMLSSAGVYALMSFTVSQRRKEIGIRIALGADAKRIVVSIFSRAALQLGAGAALGVSWNVALAKLLDADLMSGNAAAVVPAVAFVVILTGFLSVLNPTRRSLRIQPTEALRDE